MQSQSLLSSKSKIRKAKLLKDELSKAPDMEKQIVTNKLLTAKDAKGNYILDKYSGARLIEVLDKKTFSDLELAFEKKSSFDALEFLQTMISVISVNDDEVLYLIVGLYELYTEISAKINKDLLTWNDFTSYFIELVLNSQMPMDQVLGKYISEKGSKRYTSAYEKEDMIKCLPVVVAGLEHSLRRITMNLKFNDKAKHEKGIKFVQYMAAIKKVLVLDNISDYFRIYDCQGKLVSTVSPSKQIHAVDTSFVSLVWSEREKRIGATLQDFSVCMWDADDKFTYEKVLNMTQGKMQVNIWYLNSAGMWITVDSSNVFHRLRIEEDIMDDFEPRHKEKITAVLELPSMRAFAASSLDKKLIFWDPYKLIDIKTIDVKPVSIHSLFFAANFNLLVTVAYESVVSVWKLDLGLELNLMSKLQGHNSQITSLYVFVLLVFRKYTIVYYC